MKTILVFGTSVTYGAWDQEGGWVQRLRKYVDQNFIKKKGEEFLIYNLGVGGNTSKDILERIEPEAKERLKDLEEDGKIIGEVITILSFGKNDCLINNTTKENWFSLEDFGSNLKKIIYISKGYSNKLVFVGNGMVDENLVDPMRWEGFEQESWSYKNEIIEKYEEKIKEVCKKNKIPFIDVTRKFKELDYKKLLHDGIHPNSEGHKLIFEIVKSQLIKEKIIS